MRCSVFNVADSGFGKRWHNVLHSKTSLENTYTTMKVVSCHQLHSKTALKNTYTTSKAVSWDLLTTFWNIAGNAATWDLLRKQLFILPMQLIKLWDVLYSMLLIVALGNSDTMYYILKHLLKIPTQLWKLFLVINYMIKELSKIPT